MKQHLWWGYRLEAEDTRWPSDKKVAFAIRDDDVSYFTQPRMLDTLYKEAWRLGFKVSLAVIPYVKASKRGHVPPGHKASNKSFSIRENRELVKYLMEKMAEGYVDIVQHGYTHAREEGKSEFAIDDFRLIDKRLRRGNKLLRETFKRKITVFVAPHERVSRAAWKSISRNGMCLCRRFTLGRFLLTAPIQTIDFRRLARNLTRSPNPFNPISSSLIDWADMLVIQWDAFFWSRSRRDIRSQLEDAKEIFLRRLGSGGSFVLAHHHWDYFLGWKAGRMKQDMLACLKDLLNLVSSHEEVWKTSLSEIYSKAKFDEYNC